MKTIQAKVMYIFALFALLFISLCPRTGKGASRVYAAENVTSLDGTAVMDDLQDADLAAIERELTGEQLYVISFTEYAFAFNTQANGNFGLYVYVYNPSQKPVIENTTQNKINLGVEYAGTEVKGYGKFTLRCLSVSENGKYLKFKVLDQVSAATGETILSRVSKSKLQRIYDVAEIETCHKYGEIANSYAVGKRYICTGFAQGYGQDEHAASTLDVFSEEATTIQLDVHSTQYRLDGNNGKNLYTQDSLHSVYFTVSKEYGEKYGELTAVHAQWLDALLNPILVTGNQDAHDAISPKLGVDLGESGRDENLNFLYLGACKSIHMGSALGVSNYSHEFGFSYNALVHENGGLYYGTGVASGESTELRQGNRKYYGKSINPLYVMLNAGSGTNSADGYIPPSEGEYSLANELVKATAKYGGELVEERYSRVLFERVDNDFTEVRIQSTDEFKIKDVGIDKAEWWEKLFGGRDEVDKNTLDRFKSVKGIETVTDDVMNMSKEYACETLKIGLHDYNAFYNYYQANKNKGTVYLFRYKVSDYVSEEATLFKKATSGLSKNQWFQEDTNAYFFQEEADIGFDIIDITLTNEQGEHVLGVAAKPIDVFPTPTPPLEVTDDSSPWSELLFWLKMIIGIIVVILVVVAVCIICPPIGTCIIYLLLLPFNALAWIAKKIGGAFHKRE